MSVGSWRAEGASRRLAGIASCTLAILAATTYADIYPYGGRMERFIGHADQANLAVVARNIAEGRGAVTDTVWLLRGGGLQYGAVSHPEDYWSVYAATVVAVFFRAFGASRDVLLLAASLMKAIIALVAARWVWAWTGGSRLATLTTVLLLSLWPSMLAQVTGLSDIYLSAAVIGAASAFALAISGRSRVAWLLAGLLSGVAIGMKPSGALLLGVPLGFALYQPRTVARPWLALMFFAVGLAAGVAPQVHHNYRYFGQIDPVRPHAYHLVAASADVRVATGSHDVGFYDPGPAPAPVAAFPKLKNRARNAAYWLGSGIGLGEIVPSFIVMFFAFFVVRMKDRLKWGGQPGTSVEAFTQVGLMMVVAAVLLAWIVHYEGRYWAFLMPILTVPAVIAMHRTSKVFLVVTLVLAMLNGAYYYSKRQVELVPIQYGEIDAALPAGEPVMINHPWEFSFHTRRGTVMAPVTSDEASIRRLAERYGVRFLAIIKGETRHEIYDGIVRGRTTPSWLRTVTENDSIYVGEFDWK